MRLLVLTLVVGLFYTLPSWSQCGTAGVTVTLSTQTAIDDFQSTLPAGCTEYLGNITITVNGANLMPLSFLTKVEGTLDLTNNALTQVDGLSALTSVGGLNLNNNAFTQVDGLSALTSVGFLVLANNPNLTHVDGLSSLTSAGQLSLNDNALTQVDGLSGLTSVGFLNLNSNNLTQLDGLSGLTSAGSLLLQNNALTQVDGLSSLTSVGTLTLEFNDLTQVDGLANLTSVGGFLILRGNANLTQVDGLSALTSVGRLFLNNNALTQVDGLSALTSVGLFLNLSNNNLTQVDGLSSLTSVGRDLDLRNNASLSKCCGLYPLFINNGLGGSFFASGNPAACDQASDITNGGPCTPSITLSGNGNAILCGSTTAQASNGTDLGTTLVNTPITQTFSITNSDTDDLLLIGSMATSTNGAFTIDNLPAFVPANTTLTFTVSFSFATTGTQSSTIQIGSNDPANSPACNFFVQATVTPPPPPPIPTMGQWGLMILSLLLLIYGTVVVTQPALAMPTGGRLSIRQWPFEPALFVRYWMMAGLVLLLIFMLAIQVFAYELTLADPFGATGCSVLLAYWGYLVKGER